MGTQSVDAKITISTWTLGLLISLLIIYSTGIVDDLIGLDAKVKFATQIIAACILPFAVCTSTICMVCSAFMLYLII